MTSPGVEQNVGWISAPPFSQETLVKGFGPPLELSYSAIGGDTQFTLRDYATQKFLSYLKGDEPLFHEGLKEHFLRVPHFQRPMPVSVLLQSLAQLQAKPAAPQNTLEEAYEEAVIQYAKYLGDEGEKLDHMDFHREAVRVEKSIKDINEALSNVLTARSFRRDSSKGERIENIA